MLPANRRSRIEGGRVHKLNNTFSLRAGKNQRIEAEKQRKVLGNLCFRWFVTA
jgi:cobyric acid synthase